MLNGNAVSFCPTANHARDRSLARVIPWVPNVRSQAVHCHTICSLPHIRRRTKPSSRVSRQRFLITRRWLTTHPSLAEAALDANAPVEDEDESNQGPVDSDEETGAVMAALSTWKPKPLVPQPVFQPIKRQYQLARLHEQLQMATNGGRTNIFQVIGYGAQKLPEGHPAAEDGDAEGEDAGTLSFPTSARSSSFAIPATPSRPASAAARG